MTAIQSIEPFSQDDAEISTDGNTVKFCGVMSMRSPVETLSPYLEKVHHAVVAAGLLRVDVDIRELEFMNSSSIRALVDWVELIRKLPESQRYVLSFQASPSITWQSTTLEAIQALDSGCVDVVWH